MTRYHFKDTYLRNQRRIKPEFIGKSNKVRMRVVDQTCLDTLLLSHTIMLSDYSVLDKLQGDYNRSGMVGVKATNYMPKPKSSGFDFSPNLVRRKVMECVSYIKQSLGNNYYEILLKLLNDKDLSKKDLEWLNDKKKVGQLSTRVEEFYHMWNKS